ncbi:hypothetical protein BH10PSE12_BH10PSE12_04100 [soil metagenome]
MRAPVESPMANVAGLAGRSGAEGIIRKTAMAAVGPFTLAVSADRSKSLKSWTYQPSGMNRRPLRGMGATVGIGLSDDIMLVAEGAYARMKRHLSVVDEMPVRLSTKIARVGLGLLFTDTGRLALDYVSVGRSARRDSYIRMAETFGGAPMTGHGPELSFQTTGGQTAGWTQWRFSLASMSRPERDYGFDSSAMRHDARAMTSFALKL